MYRPLTRFACITLLYASIFSFCCFQSRAALGQQEEFPLDDFSVFTLRDLNADLEFIFEYEDEEERRPRLEDDKLVDTTFEQKRSRYEERVTLDGSGSVYHPNLLQFDAEGTFGLRQEDYRGDFKDQEDETLYEYDLNVKALKEKPFNFNVFANQFSTTIDRDFFESVDVDTSGYGVFFQYLNDLVPSTLFIQNQETDEDSNDFSRDRNEDVVELKLSNLWHDIVDSDFRYTYHKTVDEVIDEFENIRNDVMLVNVVDYNTLHGTSNISNYNNTGDIDTNLFQLIESFYVDHSDTFRTLYDYNFSRFETDDFTSNRNLGSFGFLHRLYESLESELRGEFSLTDEDDFEEFYYGPRVDLKYRKDVPAGKLSAGYDFLYRVTDREVTVTGRGIRTQRIFGEKIILKDGRRVFLRYPNVIAESIVVRDGERRVLTPHADYKIITSANLIEIRRIGLPSGTEIQVDYEFSASPDLTYKTYGNTLYLRYDVKQFLTIYSDYNSIDYNLTSGTVGSKTVNFLADSESILYGAEVRWRWFEFSAEYEDDTSDLVPFEAVRLNGRFQMNPTDSALLVINGDHIKTDYREERGSVTFDSIQASLGVPINSFFNSELEAGYMQEDGRDIDDRIWRFSGEVSTRLRSIEMELETEYTDRNEIRNDRDDFRVEFKIIRQFDIL